MGRFMELSVTFHIIVRLLFLFYLQGGSKVIGQFTDLMDANLLEDVTISTNESSCERRKRSAVKRSSSEVDDCLEYRYKCPDQVRISWLQAAPFVYEASSNDNKSDEEHTANMKGIFPEVVTRAIARCCKIFAGTIPQIRFLERASNLTTLRHDLLRGKADMIIPVHNDEEKYGGSLPYIKILDSPGVILIVPHRQPIKEWKLVLNAVLGTWPVVLIALLMSSIAGVVMWVLDSSKNPDEFPRRFHRGAFEGFWWAIVTITTIGYGDKTPKSVPARLFAVVWILTGVTVCSVMTATLTDALTSVKHEEYDVTSGKRIAVLRDSAALQDAVNLAANITILEDNDEMYHSLINGEGIDGIMEDIFIGIQSMKIKDKSRRISIAKFIGRVRNYGVAYNKGLFEEAISDCLSFVIKFRYDDVLNITRNYIRATTDAKGHNTLPDSDTVKVFNPRSPAFLAFVITLSVFLCGCLIVCGISFFLTKYLNNKQLTMDTKTLTATDHENTTSTVIVYQKVEPSSSICHDGQQQTKM